LAAIAVPSLQLLAPYLAFAAGPPGGSPEGLSNLNNKAIIGLTALAGAALLVGVALHSRKPAQPDQESIAGEHQPAKLAVANPLSPLADQTQPISSDPAILENVRLITNVSLALSERQRAVEDLAQHGSAQSLAALKRAFTNGSGDLRVAIAVGLGKCTTPECFQWLSELLQDPNVLVARGAVRGLAAVGTAEAANALIGALYNADASPDLRAEIALNLGAVDQPGVVQALADAARAPDEDLAGAALISLGGRDFAETESFFAEFLRSPEVAPDLRVQATEALAQAKGDPSAFLLGLAQDPDADVRVAAAWALSATETSGTAGPQVLDLLKNETDPAVRLRLYQALGNQTSFDPIAALNLVQGETDPSARIAGLDLLAKSLRDNPSPAVQAFFDQTAAPELKNDALSAHSFDDRQAAIIALTRARTPASQAALQELASQLAPGH